MMKVKLWKSQKERKAKKEKDLKTKKNIKNQKIKIKKRRRKKVDFLKK